MNYTLEGLLQEIKKVGESVIADLHNWTALSHVGACNVRQLVMTIVKVSETDYSMAKSIGMEELAMQAFKLRLEVLLQLRKSFEDSVKMAYDAAFARELVEESKIATAVALAVAMGNKNSTMRS